jgi:hypothetical protein
MSFPPITIDDLDSAGPIDFDNDLMLIRQGLNDKKVTPNQINNFKLENFTTLPSKLVATDVILVGRNNGSGYDNYISDPRRLGFLSGVTMWFYCDLADVPLYWSSQSSLGDRVLAVKGPVNSGSYQNQGLQGTWQQTGHAITIAQMPAHSHTIKGMRSGESSTARVGRGSSTQSDFYEYPAGIAIGETGGSQMHDHGNTWRPAAAVGLVCLKTG